MSVRNFITKYFGNPVAENTTIRSASTVAHPILTLPVIRPKIPQDNRTYHIFTDGGCENNGKRNARGGFGIHFYNEPFELNMDISEPLQRSDPQTNNRAELRAIQAALVYLDSRIPFIKEKYDEYWIWTDSEYSIHSLTKWASGWKKNGWKKKDGTTIQNLDIIQDVYDTLEKNKTISLHYVKGHNNAQAKEFPWCGNVKADALATAAIRSSSSFSRSQ
jgi:ribonuclease HI